MPGQSATTFAAIEARGERKRHGHADYEKEKRKDQISRSPAIPFGVLKRPVDVFPTAGIVDQDHGRDGGAAEYVERNESASAGAWRGIRREKRGRCSRVHSHQAASEWGNFWG